MKTCVKKSLVVPLLTAALGCVVAAQVRAQTFSTLHNFTSCDRNTLVNLDGWEPNSPLTITGNTLYGATAHGGTGGGSGGTVFALSTDGSGFTTLHRFTAASAPYNTNSGGAVPYGGLVLSGNTLYGTTGIGGSGGSGTVFAINTDGTGFTTIYTFTATTGPYPSVNSDGAGPHDLILSSNTLYGTANHGGSGGSGTVFAVNTDGTVFRTLYSFSQLTCWNCPNGDGAYPQDRLILSGSTLFGTTLEGGTGGSGTVFAVNTDGTGFTTLYSFTAATFPPPNINTDGLWPYSVILSGNMLYGMTHYGGLGGSGTAFRLNTDGTGFMILHSFESCDQNDCVNSEGADPWAGLTLSGNTLYGATYEGGSGDSGTVFALNTDGTGFTVLHTFSTESLSPKTFPPWINSDGHAPQTRLVLSGNTLYGTADDGGSGGNGTIFSISLPVTTSTPKLTIVPIARNVVLTWPTNVANFTLQSSASLDSSGTWTTNLPAPVIINGQNTVTNPISAQQRFYRLTQ
jgi:uncharacterized repeat protein (TIGR03803 family)